MSESKKHTGKPAPAAVKGQLSDADAANVTGGATAPTSSSPGTPTLRPIVNAPSGKMIVPCV
jgi:hypothetical protein